MDGELIGQFVPLFQTLVWVLVIAIVVISFRKKLIALLDKLASADELEMSLGFLNVQAKTIRELHHTIGLGFPGEQVSKSEIDALMDVKLRGIQAAIEKQLSADDVRISPRIQANEEIIITRESGEMIAGITVDVNEAGIGFKSSQRLRFAEVVKIASKDPQKTLPGGISNPVQIVRIELINEGYHYGAALPAVL